MHENGVNIYSSVNFKIDFFPTPKPSGRLLITFTEYTNRKLDGVGFGGKFAIDNGFDLIAIKSDCDDWYKSLPISAFDVIEEFLATLPQRHNFRATYGSSMGGYAALLFARNMKARVAFALSPQFDLALSGDPRWRKLAEKIGAIRTLSKDDLYSDCKYFIAYDPENLDKIQAMTFADVIPERNLRLIKVYYAGHPVGHLLQASNILKDLSISIFRDDSPPRISRNLLRSGRNAYSYYYYNISAHCLARGKISWGLSLIQKATKLEPLNAEYQILAARLYDAGNDPIEAISHAALAVALAPQHPHMLALLSVFLMKKGLLALALTYIERALAIEPDYKVFRDQRAEVERRLARAAS